MVVAERVSSAAVLGLCRSLVAAGDDLESLGHGDIQAIRNCRLATNKASIAMPATPPGTGCAGETTVQSVADNFSLPPIMIRRWNHLRGNSLHGR